MERFKILGVLGEGSAGRVLRAKDSATGREVALKFLSEDAAGPMASLFRSEAGFLSRLSHPNLLKIHDYFPAADGRGPYFSMEIAPGRAFDETVAASLSVPAIIDAYAQACRGLDSLHGRGLLHRDLKPENVFFDGRTIKILDYGLAGAAGRTGGLALGTPAYMAPEAFRGEYDAQSDLFSLGVLFYRALTGRNPYARPLQRPAGVPVPPPLAALRPDLPKEFAALIDLSLRLDPAGRPRSARGILRYLKRNGFIADALPAEAAEAVLEKVPWVERAESRVLENLTGIARVTGPSGVGRSRFAAESKLALNLKGRENVFVHGDLHRRTADELRALRVTVREQSKRPGALILLEYDADARSEDVKEFLKDAGSVAAGPEIFLSDFSPAQSEVFLKNACLDLDAPPAERERQEIVSASGGRPLLLLENLRQRLRGGARDLPENLLASCRVRVAALAETERRVLAFVVVHPEAVSVDALAALAGDAAWETAAGLLRSGFLASSADSGNFVLAHPSLREAYEKGFDAAFLPKIHDAWLNLLLRETGETPVASPMAALLLAHAFGAARTDAAQDWKEKALDVLFQQGRHREGLAWCGRLLETARNDADRYVVHAYAANFRYRLGAYEAALTSYEAWKAVRPDDGTGLIPLRYHLNRGQVFLAWGKSEEARDELEKSLKLGDDARHPHHRPWHAQALLLIATLDERAGDLAGAREKLDRARPLAEGRPDVAGEIEYRSGLLRQAGLEWKAAEAHFRRALDLCRPLGNLQVEATITGALALLERARGRPRSALGLLAEALEAARRGGELLQQGTLLANRAFVFLDAGDAAAAAAAFDKAVPFLYAVGGREEAFYAELYRAASAGFVGQSKAALKILETLGDSASAPLLIVRAETHYRARDFERALSDFAAARRAYAASGDAAGELSSRVGEVRAGLRLNRPVSFPAGARLPEGSPAEVWSLVVNPSAFPELWTRIEATESPEVRADLWETLGETLARRGFTRLAKACRSAAKKEKISIFKRIPEEYQMTMDNDKNLSQFEKSLAEHASSPSASGGSGKRQISESRFRQFCAVSRQIVQKKNPGEVLERMMDAALEMTGAERGFILVKSTGAKDSPLPGFEVRTARHMNQRALHEKEFQLSLSTVRDVIAKGIPALTNDAQLDPRFLDKKSVAIQGLKSILVVPLESEGEVVGVLYLDHRYQADCFSDEDVTVLAAFASLCSLALENARVLDELARAKQALEGRVQDQTVKIHDLETELDKKRTDLKFGYEEIIGQSRPMMKVFRALDNITETNVPVWIFGESGTGKELVAKSLHYNSVRKDKAFVAENVSAIPETLLESELFGHKKGSFTHADRDRVGLFEQADGGTLFLDEIADMSPAMQVKLLRVLQEGEVRPVGGTKKVKVDVRLVTASNKDLRKLVKAGKFREDLFYRINGMTISLPPLRDRKEDMPLLITHLIDRAAKSLGLPVSEVDNEAMDVLLRHDWPGNIRELEATLRNALVFTRGKPIGASHLKGNEELMASLRKKTTIPEAHEESKQIENKAEKELLVDTLKRHRMDKKAAASEMGVSLKTLYARMAVHNIPKKKTVLAGFLGLRD